MSIHNRHTSADTEVLVHIDLASWQLQACQYTLDRHADVVGDVEQLRRDLNDARRVLCAVADFANGARALGDTNRYLVPRYGFTISAIVLGYTFGEDLQNLFATRWVGVVFTLTAAVAVIVAIWWGLGRLFRGLDYRATIRDAQLPDDDAPRQDATALDPVIADWGRHAAFGTYRTDRDQVLAGIAWTITGGSRDEDVRLPVGHVSVRTRLDVIHWNLGRAADGARPRAYDLYGHANEYLDRVAAVLVRIVEDLYVEVDVDAGPAGAAGQSQEVLDADGGVVADATRSAEA